MNDEYVALPIGQQVSLPGHFDVLVVLEATRPLFECCVRLPHGTLEERDIAGGTITLVGTAPTAGTKTPLVKAERVGFVVKSAHIDQPVHTLNLP